MDFDFNFFIQKHRWNRSISSRIYFSSAGGIVLSTFLNILTIPWIISTVFWVALIVIRHLIAKEWYFSIVLVAVMLRILLILFCRFILAIRCSELLFHKGCLFCWIVVHIKGMLHILINLLWFLQLCFFFFLFGISHSRVLLMRWWMVSSKLINQKISIVIRFASHLLIVSLLSVVILLFVVLLILFDKIILRERRRRIIDLLLIVWFWCLERVVGYVVISTFIYILPLGWSILLYFVVVGIKIFIIILILFLFWIILAVVVIILIPLLLHSSPIHLSFAFFFFFIINVLPTFLTLAWIWR